MGARHPVRAEGFTSFEDGPFDASAESIAAEPGPAELTAGARPAFDIDDKGRRESRIALSDGTHLSLIQETFVDWRAGTKVALVLKGWVNRRTADGRVPANAYTLSLAHAITLTTRKLGRTTPPIDLTPSSNGTAGFYLTGAHLNFGQFRSEAKAGRSNSLALHYTGGWILDAAGEPRDNPIDRVQSQVVLTLGGRSYVTASYAAQRGGK